MKCRSVGLQSGLAQAVAVATGVVCAASAFGGDPFFVGLEDLSGGSVASAPSGISHDGTVVLGASIGVNGLEAVRWINAGPAIGFGFDGTMTAISADRSVTAGGIDGGFPYPDEAIIWTDPDTGGAGVRRLGFLAEHEQSYVTGMSDDGAAVAGISSNPNVGRAQLAFRWTDPDAGGHGMVSLGMLGGPVSRATGISADGTVVVGKADVGDVSHTEAFRWVLTDPETGEGLMSSLGDPDGQGVSDATAVSSDGGTVVGSFLNASGESEAFVWTVDGGMRRLGFPQGMVSSSASSVSDTGVVVGSAGSCCGDPARSFIWDEAGGFRFLTDVLENDYGFDIAGWELTKARISRDGSSIFGWGVNPDGETQAWLAFLGSACDADLTGDGLVNTQDFIAFLNAWASGDPVADWNGDGTINTQDFIAYLNDWAAGC